MPDYEKMYHVLFGGITDAIENLKKLQQKTEELYIKTSEKEN